MKKYLLGIFAVVLALGLSAFGKKQAPKVDRVQPSLYWYYIGTGETIGLPVIDDDETRTKSEVFETVDCEDDLGQPDCARGYESKQTFELFAPAPTDVNGDDHIMDEDLGK